MKAIICNKCKKVIMLRLENVYTLESKVERLGSIETLHLCEECEKLFLNWIDEGKQKN